MAYPKNRKKPVFREGWVSPNRGAKKPSRERQCMRCSGTYLGFNGKGYCSRKCYFLANADQGDGCWTWRGYKRAGGYGEAYFGTKPNRERVLAHRLAYQVMVGDPGSLVVCHKCDNPSCVNPDHLFLGTITDNTRDRDEKGRQARGERNAAAKLTETQVRAIRADARGCRKLAKEYGTSISVITNVRSRRTWKHLE